MKNNTPGAKKSLNHSQEWGNPQSLLLLEKYKFVYLINYQLSWCKIFYNSNPLDFIWKQEQQIKEKATPLYLQIV